ncbi:sodium-dependent neutral amino acid transporter B(0)AT3-like, partial [Paramuricea clavata]
MSDNQNTTENGVGDLKENLRIMPKNMCLFSLSLRSLYANNAVGTSTDVAQYFEYYEALDYEEWCEMLPDIRKETTTYKEVAQTLLEMHEELMISLKKREDDAKIIMTVFKGLQSEYEKQKEKLEASAQSKMGWAHWGLSLYFIPGINVIAYHLFKSLANEDTVKAIAKGAESKLNEAGALVVANELIPALSHFIDGLKKVARFFQIVEKELQSFEGKAGKNVESPAKKLHYKVMSKKAKEIKSLCQAFYAVLVDSLHIATVYLGKCHLSIIQQIRIASIIGDMQLTQALTSDDGVAISPSHSISRTSAVLEGSEKQRTRDTWDNKVQFLLATIGFAVGLGNIWRFPGLCYKNGGGAFLLPYVVMLIIEGIPLLYLELSVGQRLKKGSLVAWSMISPYMGGVGLASVVICIFTGSYYSIVIAWCLYYLFSSFRSALPWSKCPTKEFFNFTSNRSFEIPVPECESSSSISYFFYRETLNVSESIDETTTWNWKITLCYITAWIVIYVCVIRGIKSSGKVVYFTATFPYIVLTAFFIRGLTLEGFDRGVKHLFTPQWDKLADPLIWMEAASQIFYSTGLAFGCILAFASYNPTHQNTLKDAITISLVNSGTSLFASIVVFSILGFRATVNVRQCEEANIGKNNTATCDFDEYLQRAALGPGLVFIAFSDAIRSMPAAPVWSVLFFLMCLTLGIDSLFGGLESVAASLADLKRLSKVRIEYISGAICMTCFLLGLSMVQDSGSYVVQLFDKFSANMSLLVIAICEFVSVTWFYGIR